MTKIIFDYTDMIFFYPENTHFFTILSLFCSIVSVGFEYESCPDLILWEKRTAVLQGYETIASKLGGWTIDKHHALNIQSGESASCSFSYIFCFNNFSFFKNLFWGISSLFWTVTYCSPWTKTEYSR